MSTLAKLIKPSKETADALKALLQERQQSLLDLANKLGCCTLDGEPARLEAPSPNSRRGLWVVRTLSGDHWAQFDENNIRAVVISGEGAFQQPLARRWATCL